MEKFNPYNAEGKVEDATLAHKAAQEQDKWMDKEKNVVHGFFTKKGEKTFRTKMGEKEVEEVLDKEIESIDRENYKKMALDSFYAATEIHFVSYMTNTSALVDDLRIIIKNDKDEFWIKFSDLIGNEIMTTEQLFELFEIKLEGVEKKLTVKLKKDYKNRLEEILKKKVLV